VGANGKQVKQATAYVDLSGAKPRTCLRCGQTFDSRSPGNRICPPCKGRKTMQEGWWPAGGLPPLSKDNNGIHDHAGITEEEGHMLINKVTAGFVVQVFDTDKRCFVSQNFIPGECAYEDRRGKPVAPSLLVIDGEEATLPFEMVQPDDPSGRTAGR